MKKKILFIMESLRIGGAEKSLIPFLSEINYTEYEVDLFLFRKEGEFFSQIPNEVNVLEIPNTFNYYNQKPLKSLQLCIKNMYLSLVFYKIINLFILVFYRYILKKEYIGWNFISKSIEKFEKKYDVAIGFLEKKSIYFTVDKVISKKKIGWIHTDYKKIEFNYNLDEKYLSQLDEIVTVSDSCSLSFIEIFPQLKSKVNVIENFVSPSMIRKLANEKDFRIEIKDNTLVIVTVARLTKAKNLFIIIDAMKKLKHKYKIKWFIVGDGELKKELSDLITVNDLTEEIILVGAQSNPYTFMNQADIYVQTSSWEGFGITVAEAKFLNKPIIVSNIPEFKNQINHRTTGLIYSNLEELINCIEILIHDLDLKAQLINNLKMQTHKEIKQITQLNNLLNRRN